MQVSYQDMASRVLRYVRFVLRLTSNNAVRNLAITFPEDVLISYMQMSAIKFPDWKQRFLRSFIMDRIAALSFLARLDVVSYIQCGCSKTTTVRFMAAMQKVIYSRTFKLTLFRVLPWYFTQSLLFFPQTGARRRRLARSILWIQIEKKELLPSLILKRGEAKHVRVRPGEGTEEYDVWEGEYLMYEPCIIKELRAVSIGAKALKVVVFTLIGVMISTHTYRSCLT